MKGSKSVIKVLNIALANELVGINQYFLHARMLESWGLELLGAHEFQSSKEEMNHADQLIRRLLFLDGSPEMNSGKSKIGKDVPSLLRADLQLEQHAVKSLKDGIACCETEQDYVSRDLLRSILAAEEEHVDWLETQLQLIEDMGLNNYLQSGAKS